MEWDAARKDAKGDSRWQTRKKWQCSSEGDPPNMM